MNGYALKRGCATMRGSAHNDVFIAGTVTDHERPAIATRTNRHGGMLGGITSGMPIVLRAAVKPTSSLSKEQPTVTRHGAPARS